MQEEKSRILVSNWLFLGVVMLIVQVILGGVTRLTGSGLSITEWDPIMGFLPPLNKSQWQHAFQQYQQIAQFKYMNFDFTLSDFKHIFFWEWFHRLWARSIGIVFLIPFIYFIIKKRIKPWMIQPLIGLFILGGFQGLIGWIMVKSGLNDENLYVSHIKLAVHFVAAMVLIAYTLLFALVIRVPQTQKVTNSSLKKFTVLIIVLLFIQITYGAFMAGLKAASAAPTWPTINGMWLPVAFWKESMTQNLFFNKITIHFIHRTLAYVILTMLITWYSKAMQVTQSDWFNATKKLSIVLVIVQVLLGIAAILASPGIVLGKFSLFEWLAEVHQIIGMLLLLLMITNAYLLLFKNLNT
ncbi:COX15/CtaA family protein [Hydrotalea sp.]|uniref:COX15/CtaA family protein n=1 Tax=Hydrotalea sp. TaxID=2881279 RepID=UPI002633D7FE|nr:COX15/CtaA family protein [Hydrotalea sp.]